MRNFSIAFCPGRLPIVKHCPNVQTTQRLGSSNISQIFRCCCCLINKNESFMKKEMSFGILRSQTLTEQRQNEKERGGERKVDIFN